MVRFPNHNYFRENTDESGQLEALPAPMVCTLVLFISMAESIEAHCLSVVWRLSVSQSAVMGGFTVYPHTLLCIYVAQFYGCFSCNVARRNLFIFSVKCELLLAM